MKRFREKEKHEEKNSSKTRNVAPRGREEMAQHNVDPANTIELMLEAQNTRGNEFVNDLATGNNLDINQLHAILNEARSLQGRGIALPETFRRRAEKSLGINLGDVNVHADKEAAGLAAAANAAAFTVGKDIFLPPQGLSGDTGLLAHELVHTAQQAAGNQAINENAGLEAQAEQIGNAIASGNSAQFVIPLSPVPALQRTPGAATGTVSIPDPTVDYDEYSGETLADVAALLPDDEWGRCEWDFVHTFESTNGTITRVDVTLTRAIWMPRWVERDQASAAERAEWDRMVRNLRTHENGHATRARTWAPRLKQRMLNHPESEEATIKETFLADHQREQDQYDTDTQHGRTQGVSLNTGGTE